MTEIEQLVEVYGKDAAAEESIVRVLAVQAHGNSCRAHDAVTGRKCPWYVETDEWRRKIRKAQGRVKHV